MLRHTRFSGRTEGPGACTSAGVAPLAAPARRGRASPAAAAAADLPATSQPPADAPVVLQYSQLVPALLLKRYKRFLGDVQLQLAAGTATVAATDAADDVAVHAPISIHVPNTGPMTGLLDSLPAEALLSVSTDPKRKYAHTLEWLRPVGEVGWWLGRCTALKVCAQTALAIVIGGYARAASHCWASPEMPHRIAAAG